MSGLYGDSTRSVKAVGPEAIPGAPLAQPPILGCRVPHSTERRRHARQLRALSQSNVAPIGIGPRRTGRCHRGVDVRIGDGGYHVGAASAHQTALHGGGARRRLLPGAAIRGGISCPAGDQRDRGDMRGHHRRRLERRCGARRDAVEPRPRRGRSTCLALTCRERGATLVVDNTTATPLGAATAVARRRPRGGQRHQIAFGASRRARGLRRGKSPGPDGRDRKRASGSRARYSARSRRGWCCAASAPRAYGSSANARTRSRSR